MALYSGKKDQNMVWIGGIFSGCCGLNFKNLLFNYIENDKYLKIAPTIEQADILIIMGSLSFKMISKIKDIYSDISEPKKVIAVGNCAITGGVFDKSYSIIRGVDKIIPIDLHILGCPPSEKMVYNGLKKIISTK